MKIAVQIPIKGRASTRVPNKNFRDLAGKPLSCWLLDELSSACPAEWDLYIDSEEPAVMNQFTERYAGRYQFHQRDAWYASDAANGNHLISQFAAKHPQYDLYAQAYVTAVTLPGRTVVESIGALVEQQDRYDSMLLVTEACGWFWFGGQAVNYDPTRPDGLPRSQDAMGYQETTGLYAITREAVLRTGCRIGAKPLFYPVPRAHAVDIDTMEDFQQARAILAAGVQEAAVA